MATTTLAVPKVTSTLATVSTLVPKPVAKRRGRKPGRTVSDATANHRRAWLKLVVKKRGMNGKLCTLLKSPDSFISHLLAGRRTFTDSICYKIEEVLGLPKGNIDAGVPFESATAGSAVKPTPTLCPELERALTAMLASALRTGSVSNSAALSMMGQLITR